MLRLFVAVYPPPEIARALLEAIARLELPANRLVPVEQVHVTLHFIGSTSPRELPETAESVRRAAAGLGSFQLRPLRLVGLPERAPRLMAAETDGPPALVEIQRRLAARLARNARRSPGDRFRPHLTLCRFKRPARDAVPDGALDLGAFDVRRIELMKSTLDSTGARHQVVESVALPAWSRPPGQVCFVTFSLSAAEALKLTVRDALIFRGSPVVGLRPMRGGRSFFAKVPKPVIVTALSFSIPRVIVVMNASTTRPAEAFDPPSSEASASMSWLLFMEVTPVASCQGAGYESNTIPR